MNDKIVGGKKPVLPDYMKRSEQLITHVTPRECELLTQKARHYGMTTSGYMRKLIRDDLGRTVLGE